MKSSLLILRLKLLLVLTCLMSYGSFSHAQTSHEQKRTTTKVPMNPKYWDVDQPNAAFVTYKGINALEIKGEKQVVVKTLEFTNGTIEFDVEPTDAAHSDFVSFYFRRRDTLENECVYLRLGRPHPEKRNDAIQYAPFIKGVNLWNLLYHFQGPALIHTDGWNHVKLVVSGVQLRAYVNDMRKPALEIPRMEGNTTKGSIAFDGHAVYANLVVKLNATEDVPAIPGADLTNHDANYIRSWQINKPNLINGSGDPGSIDGLKDTTTWLPITAERHALINITRLMVSALINRSVTFGLKPVYTRKRSKSLPCNWGFAMMLVFL